MIPVTTENIEKIAGVCGGRACSKGHRIRVADIVVWHEHDSIRPVSGLVAVRSQMFENRFRGLPRVLFQERLLGRQHDEPQSAVVRNVRVWSENVDAIERRYTGEQLLHHFFDFLPHIGFHIEPPFSGLHLTPQVCPCVEPEPRTIGGFVTRTVQVMESIRKPIQNVGVNRRRLSRLQATEKYTAAI